MRGVLHGASLALFSFALAVTLSAPDARSADTNHSLAEDEVYLRHGAITTMETCLTVASDPKAYRLWDRKDYFSDPSGSEPIGEGAFIPRDLKQRANQGRLIEWLDRSDNSLRRAKSDGVGTLLACAHIVAAWRAALPDGNVAADGQTRHLDGRFEHGAIVIDLALGPSAVTADPAGGDQVERAHISPVPLVRLLTSSRLLPGVVHGGVIIRNAIIAGPLLLNNIKLSLPLSFVNVQFVGGDYSKDVFNKTNVHNKSTIKDRAITIINSTFDDHFMISDSEFCGNVGIFDSVFEQTLELRKIEHKSAGCSRPDAGQTATPNLPQITIQTSKFGQDLRISSSELNEVFIYSNKIESLSSISTKFGQQVNIANNQIGSLYIDETLLGRTNAINYNEIATDFAIYGPGPEGAGDVDAPIETLQITSNRIGGGLKLHRFPATRLPVDAIELRSNRVGNGSSVCLPADWIGELELEGSVFAGVLTIGVSFVDGDSDRGEAEDARQPCRISLGSPTPGGRELGGIFDGASKEWIGRPLQAETYCDPLSTAAATDTPPLNGRRADRAADRADHGNRLRVDLTAAEVRTLQWHLPLTCDYRWSGYGLSYDLWLPHPEVEKGLRERAEGGDGVLAAFRTWRYTLRDFQPAPLDAMSRYLNGKGSYVASREIQIEAKRLNYTPNCAPHKRLYECLGSGMTKTASATPQSGDQAAGSAASSMSWIDRGRRGVALFFLMPAGYGAAPENALGWIFGGWIVFSLIYWLYELHSRRRLNDVKAKLPAVLDALTTRARKHPESDRLLAKVNEISSLLPLDELSVEAQCRLLQDTLLPRLRQLRKDYDLQDPALVALVDGDYQLGSTDSFGFSRFNPGQLPARFSPWRYSIDAMIPVIDLHAYSSYYPEARWMRCVPVIQHLLGWWWITVFVASAAIL